MTDTTAPRTAAGRRLLDVFAPPPDADDPRHAMLLRDIAAIEAEAIEPLLALVRAALDVEEWCRSAGARPLGIRHDFLGAADELHAALPESVRVAARKPE